MNTLATWFKNARATVYLLAISYILMGIFFLLQVSALPPQIPLYYSRPTGEEQIVDTFYLGIIPLLSLALVALNGVIVKRVFSENEFVKHIIYYTTNIAIIIFAIIFLRILFLVS